MSSLQNDEGSSAATLKPSKSQTNRQSKSILAPGIRLRNGRRPNIRTMSGWLTEMSAIGGRRPPPPPAVRELGERPGPNTLLTIEQAAAIVQKVAARNDDFFLAHVVPDTSGEWRPLALCDSRAMTIAVPSCGVLLGSLVAELALLHVPGFGHSSPLLIEQNYERHKAAIKTLVIAAARELRT